MMSVWMMLAFDAILGDPPGWHPVIGIGKIVSWWETRMYGDRHQFIRGLIFSFAVLFTCLGAASVVHLILVRIHFGWIIEAMLCGWFLAAKSLANVASIMQNRFENEGLTGARKGISEYVSRDTDSLSTEDVIRATAETMAENIIDGVLAPIFFFFLGQVFGSPLVGIVMYKSINTMDSMVGYRNERYEFFGKTAARMDDAANWIPARLGVFAILLAGLLSHGNIPRGFKVLLRDRHSHSSPNSAYAESAIAGLYGCRLGGPSQYFGLVHTRPWIGEEFGDPTWKSLIQIRRNIWISEVVFVLLIGGGGHLWV